jgi:histidine phosphotransferase ChpT
MHSVTLEPLDLAALLTSRLCHDLVNPVGAIVNGIEVLEDEGSGDMKDFAISLIKKSAKQASARLQFARMAFGASGSATALIDTGDAESVSRAFVQDDKNSITWSGPRLLVPKNKVKLVLNTVVIALTAIPRGGVLDVVLSGTAEDFAFTIIGTGSHARIPPHFEHLMAGESETGAIDSHAIQTHYAGLIARAAGMRVEASIEGTAVTFAGKQVA